METTPSVWPTIWQAIAALAAIVTAVVILIPYVKNRRRKKNPWLFLSMQMFGLAGNEYMEERRRIMQVVYELRKNYKIYFYNEFIQRLEDYDESTFDVGKYLREIDDCDFFIVVISEKVVSSVYIELGYALARGKKTICFISNDAVAPLIMRRLKASKKGPQFYKTTELSEIKEILENILNT